MKIIKLQSKKMQWPPCILQKTVVRSALSSNVQVSESTWKNQAWKLKSLWRVELMVNCNWCLHNKNEIFCFLLLAIPLILKGLSNEVSFGRTVCDRFQVSLPSQWNAIINWQNVKMKCFQPFAFLLIYLRLWVQGMNMFLYRCYMMYCTFFCKLYITV